MSAWQPIESAPKDGTVIDLWLAEGRRATDAYWSFSRDGATGERLPETAYDCWAYVRGSSGMGGAYPAGVDGKATHWMPIPNSPR